MESALPYLLALLILVLIVTAVLGARVLIDEREDRRARRARAARRWEAQ